MRPEYLMAAGGLLVIVSLLHLVFVVMGAS